MSQGPHQRRRRISLVFFLLFRRFNLPSVFELCDVVVSLPQQSQSQQYQCQERK